MNRLRIRKLLAPLLVFLVAGQFVTKGDDTRQFIVSVVRADGTLLPFAQYSNGGWSNPWPAPRQAAEDIYSEATEVIPHSLGDLPEPWFKQCGKVPKTWYFWTSASAPTVLNTVKVMQVENHSNKNWALLTDFPKPDSSDGHHRNIGVALNVNEKIEPLIQVKVDSVEVAGVVSFIRELFDDAEKSKLKPIQFSITSLYRSKSSLNGKYLYYFEAEKQYEKPATATDRSCHDISLFQGWISDEGNGALGLMASRLFLTDCDIKGPSTSTPLGIMTFKNETFLFVSEHGWEDERYLILELDTGLHKVLETFGG